jgi:hypothetical protein
MPARPSQSCCPSLTVPLDRAHGPSRILSTADAQRRCLEFIQRIAVNGTNAIIDRRSSLYFSMAICVACKAFEQGVCQRLARPNQGVSSWDKLSESHIPDWELEIRSKIQTAGAD